MASSEKKKKKNEMEEENIIHKVWWETYCRSNNIIQCTQKLFKVPAEVYKYVAWKAVEEKGGGGRGGWSFLSAEARNREAELQLSVVRW